jgi:hypothetical protein
MTSRQEEQDEQPLAPSKQASAQPEPPAEGKPAKKAREWTNNALVAALAGAVTGVLAGGLIALLAVHVQDKAATGQAISSEQAQELGQLEQAASSLYQDGQSVVMYQVSCALRQESWQTCGVRAPGFAAYKTPPGSNSAWTSSMSRTRTRPTSP